MPKKDYFCPVRDRQANRRSNFAPAAGLTDTLYYSYTMDGAGNLTKFNNIYTHCLDFVKTKARYVRVSFKTAGGATSISETEVYGKAGQAGETELSDLRHKVTVEGGSANVAEAAEGEIVTITAAVPANSDFAVWVANLGIVAPADSYAPQTSFLMPGKDVLLTAHFKGGAVQPLTGDANGDGKVDNLDASIVLQYDAGLEKTLPANCDVNGDGATDNLDASAILRFDAGLPSGF